MRTTGRSISSYGFGDNTRTGAGRGNVTFRHAEDEDAIFVVPLLRQRDLLHLAQQGPPTSVIREAVAASTITLVGEIDGRIAAMWGVRRAQMLDDRVYVWLLGTRVIDENPVTFLRYSRYVLRCMRAEYRAIYGEIEVDFSTSVRWLTWLGAKVYPHEGRYMFVI